MPDFFQNWQKFVAVAQVAGKAVMDLALVCCVCGWWRFEGKNASMVHCNWPNYIQICQHYANKGKIKQDFEQFDVVGVGSSTHLVRDVSNNGSASYIVIVTFCHFASLQCILHGGTGNLDPSRFRICPMACCRASSGSHRDVRGCRIACCFHLKAKHLWKHHVMAAVVKKDRNHLFLRFFVGSNRLDTHAKWSTVEGVCPHNILKLEVKAVMKYEAMNFF